VSDPIDQEIRILRAIFWSERDPEGRAFVPLADAYLRKGSPDEALSLLEDGLGRHPDFASAHMVAARAYRAVGARGSVHRALGSVLELDPGNASALRMKGELAESEGNTAVALTAFREALDRNPDYEDLPGRIERLALGMPPVDFEPIDAPGDDPPGDDGLAAGHDDDAGLPEDDGLPQADKLSQDLPGEGIERGSAVAGSSTSFSMEPGPGETDAIDADLIDADLIDVDFVDADLVEPDLVDPGRLEEGLAEAEPADSDFGIEDFPTDEPSLPAAGVNLDPGVLGTDRLELAPPPPGEAEEGERRTGDLEAHEALAAERGAGRSDEVRSSGDDSNRNLRDVDVIDPFGFDPLVAPAETGASLSEGSAPSEGDAPSEGNAPSEGSAPEGQGTQPPDSDDDDAPDWSLPSEPEGPRVSGVEPLPVTRTLGELYARQGLLSQAADVFEALVERNPEDESLRARLSELRTGSPPPPADARGEDVSGPSPSADASDRVDAAEPVEMSMVAEDDEAVPEEAAPETVVADPETAVAEVARDRSLEAGGDDAPHDDVPYDEGAPGVSGFSPAAQPVGAWFADLLSWAPGAVPVEELAPGAVPIESLAPVGWVAAPAAEAEPSPDAEPEADPSPDAEPEAVLPEPGNVEQALPEATATPPGMQLEPPPGGQPESPASDGTDSPAPSDGESSPGASPQDGFEGLDDFQDWLRSLDR